MQSADDRYGIIDDQVLTRQSPLRNLSDRLESLGNWSQKRWISQFGLSTEAHYRCSTC